MRSVHPRKPAAVAAGDRRQLAGRHVRVLRPSDPVDEAYGQVEAGRIPDERRELAG